MKVVALACWFVILPAISFSQQINNWRHPVTNSFDTSGWAKDQEDIEEMYIYFKEYLRNPFNAITYMGQEYLSSEFDRLTDNLFNDFYNNGKLASAVAGQEFQPNKKYSLPVQFQIKAYAAISTVNIETENDIKRQIDKADSEEEVIFLEIQLFRAMQNKVSSPEKYTTLLFNFFDHLKSRVINLNNKNFGHAEKALKEFEQGRIVAVPYLEGDKFYTICVMASGLFREMNQNDMSTYFLIQAASYYDGDSAYQNNSAIHYELASNFHNTTNKKLEEKAFAFYQKSLEYAQKMNQSLKPFVISNTGTYLYFNYINSYTNDEADRGSLYNIYSQLYHLLAGDSIKYYKTESYILFLNIANLAQHRGDYVTAQKYFQLGFIYRTLYGQRNDWTFLFDLGNLVQITSHVDDKEAVAKYFKMAENYYGNLSTESQIIAACNYAERSIQQQNTGYAKSVIEKIEKSINKDGFNVAEQIRLGLVFSNLKLKYYQQTGNKDSVWKYQLIVTRNQNITDGQIENIYAYEREYKLDQVATPLVGKIEKNLLKLNGLESKIQIATIELNNNKVLIGENSKKITSLKETVNQLDTALVNRIDENKKFALKATRLSDAVRQLETEKEQLSVDIKKGKSRIAEQLYWIIGLTAVALLLIVGGFYLGQKLNKKRKELKIVKDAVLLLKEEKNLLSRQITELKEEKERILQENDLINYKLQLDKSKAEMKLLSNLAVNHDIDKFIPLLPGYIDKVSDETKPKLKKAVEDFRSYYLLTKHTGNVLTNTLKAEMEIARKSSSVYRYISRSKTEVSITCNFERDPVIENLEIPKNMLTGFIANSVKHGSVGKTAISIDVNVTRVPQGVLVTITDDGAGFEQLYLEGRSDDKGINLVIQQVENYNESNAGIRIIFSQENIKSPGLGQGTIVQFKMISEWKEETLL